MTALKPAPGTATSGQAVQRDALGDFGRKVLGVLSDPASWKAGLVHDVLVRAAVAGPQREEGQ